MNNINIQSYLESITSDYDIKNIFGDLDKFQKQGKGYKACCPFHNDNNPSLHINIKDNIILYHCFVCNEGGNIINFIAKQHSLDISKDFKEILQIISNLTNTPIPEALLSSKEETKTEKDFKAYHNTLIDNDKAIQHLYKRGIKDLSIFGYENNKYKILSRHLNNYDIIEYMPNGDPKYKFSKGFKKHIPFNLYRFNKGDLWITEGIFDCLNLYEVFNKQAIAILGSELQNNTINLLKRYDNIIIALDNDEPGKQGTIKAIHKLYSKGFINIFYVDYSAFNYKDFNEAYQNNDNESIKQVLNNVKYGYDLLLNNHIKQITLTNNNLTQSKILNDFLNDIISYQEIIQNKITKIYSDKIGHDIKDELKLHKDNLKVSDFKNELESINKDTITLETIEQLNDITSKTLSNTQQVEIYNFEDLQNDNIQHGINSNFIEDIKYYEGALSFIGARTGHGKTTYMINEAVNFAMNNKVAFISLEESFNWIGSKLFVCYYNTKHNEYLELKSYFKDKQNYINDYKELSNNLYVIDKGNTIDQIEKYLLYMHNHLDINIFFVDYIQRISVNGKHTKLSRQEQIKYINDRLLNLVKKYNLIFISGSQFNRMVSTKDQIKSTHAYREAGDIEQDANLLINLWKEDKKEEGQEENENSIYYYIAKNRNGKSNKDNYLTAYFKNWIIERT